MKTFSTMPFQSLSSSGSPRSPAMIARPRTPCDYLISHCRFESLGLETAPADGQGAALWTIPWISFDTTGVNSLAPSLPKLGDFWRQEVMQRKSTSRVHCSRTQRPLLKVSPPPKKETCQPITSPHFSIIRPNSNPYPLTKNLTFFSFSTASFFFVHLIECKISSLFITGLTTSTFFLNKTLNITPLNLRNAFQNLSVSSPKVRFI